MGCNCGAARGIMRLHGTYGVGDKSKWNDMPVLKRYLYTVLLYAAMFLMSPFIVVYVVAKVFGEGRINISNVLGLNGKYNTEEFLNVGR